MSPYEAAARRWAAAKEELTTAQAQSQQAEARLSVAASEEVEAWEFLKDSAGRGEPRALNSAKVYPPSR